MLERGFTHSRQVADYFDVPEEVIRLQAPMNWTDVSGRLNARERAAYTFQR